VTPRHYDEERRRRELAVDERFSLCPDHPAGADEAPEVDTFDPFKD
jgi:hypothetical protein